MNNNKKNRIDAYLSDDAYEAFKNGEAVSNNGFRSQKGNYWSDQPDFEIPSGDYEYNKIKNEVVFNIIEYVTIEVVGPPVKRFVQEKVYPFLSNKWDNFIESRQQKKNQLVIESNNSDVTTDDNIINLEQYINKVG